MTSFFTKSTVFISALSIGALAGQATADTVLLHPGTLSGTVNLSGETVTGGYVSAYSNDGFSAQAYFSGPSYNLTVEGDHSYTRYVDNTLSNGSTASYLSISHGTYVLIPVDSTVNGDFTFSAARISGAITVQNGTLNSYTLYAYASENTDYFYSRHYNYTGNGAYSIPMIVDTSVSVYGFAQVTSSLGDTLTLPLSTQTIDLVPAGTTVNWTVDANQALGSISGNADMNNLSGPEIISSHAFYAYGADSSNSGSYEYTSLSANGTYLLDGMLPGNWYQYTYSYFDGPYGLYYHPGRYTNVVAGQVTQSDYVNNLSFQHGFLNLAGFFNVSQLNYGQVAATGQYPSASYGATAVDYVNSSGQWDLVMTPGDWKVNNYYLQFVDTSTPGQTQYNTLQTYLYDWPDPNLMQTFVGGENISGSSINTGTIETNIIFDVAEAPGDPEELIDTPQLYGWAYDYGNGSSLRRAMYLNAVSYSSAAGQQTLRIVGEAGQYDVYAYAHTGGSTVQFARFTLQLVEPVQVPVGMGVTVHPTQTVGLTFSDVTGAGVVTATSSPIGPQQPEGFQIYSQNGTPIYYDITTTATFNGNVEVCLDFDPNTPLLEAQTMHLYHYDSSLMTWVDITSPGYPDVNLHRVCGITTSFSVFALMFEEPTDDDYDGIDNASDNCPSDYNPDQADFDADGQGDVCDVDDDNDSIADSEDNCPTIANKSQADFDKDGSGDACDDDDDDDGVLDGADKCAMTATDAAIDGDGCSSAQRLALACPTTATYRNHGEYVKCVASETNTQVSIGLITGSQKGAIQSEAAQSSIGN